MESTNNTTPAKMLSLDLIEENDGQLFGLPANPREIAPEKFELLKADIQKYPQFLQYNALKVYPMNDGKYILIGGNMRCRALKELGFKEVPCVIIPRETHVEELKAYIILDNSSFGKWDWTKLASEDWDAAQLQEWGIEASMTATEVDIDSFFEENAGNEPKEKDEHIVVIIPSNMKDDKETVKSIIERILSDEGYNLTVR